MCFKLILRAGEGASKAIVEWGDFGSLVLSYRIHVRHTSYERYFVIFFSSNSIWNAVEQYYSPGVDQGGVGGKNKH